MINGRRSIRGFSDRTVTPDTIRESVTLASRAPSSMNTQPRYLYVVTGDPLDRIRQGNTERNLTGIKPSREIISHGDYKGVHRER